MALARIRSFLETELEDMASRNISDEEKGYFKKLFNFNLDDMARLISEYVGIAVKYIPTKVEIYLDNRLKRKGMELSKAVLDYDAEYMTLIRNYKKKNNENNLLFEIEYNKWFFILPEVESKIILLEDGLIKAVDIEKLILRKKEETGDRVIINTGSWSVRCDFTSAKHGEKITADIDVWAPSFWASQYLSKVLNAKIDDQSDISPDTRFDKQYGSYKKIIDDLLGLVMSARAPPK